MNPSRRTSFFGYLSYHLYSHGGIITIIKSGACHGGTTSIAKIPGDTNDTTITSYILIDCNGTTTINYSFIDCDGSNITCTHNNNNGATITSFILGSRV